MLRSMPNMAEGIKVVGTRFKVVDIGGVRQLQLVNSSAGFPDGDFSSFPNGWGVSANPAARLTLDTSVSHSTPGSIRMMGKTTVDTSENARIIHPFTVLPWRTYHLRFWYRLQGAPGGSHMTAMVLDSQSGTVRMPWTEFDFFKENKDWTQFDFSFNSLGSTSLNLYLGFWGDMPGTAWLDDVQLEEVGLVNVLNRAGTPSKVYDPASGTVYTVNTDYSPIHDPIMEANNGVFNSYHTPPTITIPAGSRLTLGQTVAIDSYSAFPTDIEKIGSCLLEPAVIDWIKRHAQGLDKIMPAGTGYFMSQDEMREMRTCDLCKSQSTSAGDLLTKHMGLVIAALKSVRPAAPLYIWSDMFDPYHNANDTSSAGFLIDGSVTGSWNGLPSDVIIMNWNLGNLSKSLRFFAGKDSSFPTVAHRQVIAGYYDTGDGAGAANTEMDGAIGVPGINGFLYTTWNADYTQLKAYADTVKKRWPDYLKSLP